MSFDYRKYKTFPGVTLAGRQWPDRRIERAPLWCSVDLRDGNQALIEPMSPPEKMKLFELLVEIGFTQIEVGFPAASQTDFDFVRELIEGDRVPDHVAIQVLTQARPEIIARTFEAVRGARKAIMHVYNATSPLHRDKVFRLDKPAIKQIALDAAAQIRALAAAAPETDWTFQYSPEGFTATELEFAAEVCNGVSAIWQPTPERPMIVTLPATVEMATPNVYADQIEWLCSSLRDRDAILVGTHTHNDRGCAVAAAELALMAGAQRVEGTLLGNGERCGNMDIVVMAMNLYSQGIDPGLDLRAMDRILSVVTGCTRIEVHPRHPYCGDLVFTAFSGGHQDAIRKCLDAVEPNAPWEVTYLPIDPADLGRSYQDVIRINSQSGKGGVTYILETRLGGCPPRWLQIDFSRVVQAACEESGGELGVDAIWRLFLDHYLRADAALLLHAFAWNDAAQTGFTLRIGHAGKSLRLRGSARALDALVDALATALQLPFELLDTHVQPLSNGPGGGDTQAIAYVRLIDAQGRHAGVAIGASHTEAFVLAMLQAAGRALAIAALDAAEPVLPIDPILPAGTMPAFYVHQVEHGHAD